MAHETRADRPRGGATRLAILLYVATLGVVGPARADLLDHLWIEGLQDVTLHGTDSGSRLLSRNAGDPAGTGQLRLWVAAEPLPRLQTVVVGSLQGSTAREDRETDGSLQQAFARYVVPGKFGAVIDAGKLVVPFGNFSQRYLSSVNPLIGAPDTYDVNYPLGALATGKVGRFDYRAALFDRPLSNGTYLPPSGKSFRPGAAVGFTPMIGLRFGAYATRGAYLGRDATPILPPGPDWEGYEQEISGFELTFSRGYFELNGDVTYSSYEVPTKSAPSRGAAWFVDAKYTWTPRLFTAVRVERSDYPYIRGVDPTFWIAVNAEFTDVEVGGGWRFSRGLLLKASYRWDNWSAAPSMASMFPDGRALAVQLSYGFQVSSWLRRER